MREAPHLLDYTMAANHGLLEEDGVFWFYVDTCQVNACNDPLHITVVKPPVGRGFHCIPYLAHILY